MARKKSEPKLTVVTGGQPQQDELQEVKYLVEKMIVHVLVGKWVGNVRVDEWWAHDVPVLGKAGLAMPWGGAVEEALTNVLSGVHKKDDEKIAADSPPLSATLRVED